MQVGPRETDIDAAFINPAMQRSLASPPRPDSAAAATDTYLAKAGTIFQVPFRAHAAVHCILKSRGNATCTTGDNHQLVSHVCRYWPT